MTKVKKLSGRMEGCIEEVKGGRKLTGRMEGRSTRGRMEGSLEEGRTEGRKLKGRKEQLGEGRKEGWTGRRKGGIKER